MMCHTGDFAPLRPANAATKLDCLASGLAEIHKKFTSRLVVPISHQGVAPSTTHLYRRAAKSPFGDFRKYCAKWLLLQGSFQIRKSWKASFRSRIAAPPGASYKPRDSSCRN
jgi:hypothetical protein